MTVCHRLDTVMDVKEVAVLCANAWNGGRVLRHKNRGVRNGLYIQVSGDIGGDGALLWSGGVRSGFWSTARNVGNTGKAKSEEEKRIFCSMISNPIGLDVCFPDPDPPQPY
ncbi:hypothetical protein FA13DRAFT_1729474 [Coprinellus micaceus]|uniref:Uncharacterized protein n=1 Tax=Coprinellus micaceus TaxID=71717 RepID=A0A4Y7TLH4_COPMI|nr:hypothetical protein FA13DRAFT_1729474 [Coprinellus micaceus]